MASVSLQSSVGENEKRGDSAMMEIGTLCDHPFCGVKTYLPFHCDGCGKSFCREHRNYAEHDCPKGMAQASLSFCKICKRNIRVPPREDPERVMQLHRSSEKCIPRAKKEKRRRRCKAKRCKEIILIPFKCAECRELFCAKHRTPDTHACKGKPVSSIIAKSCSAMSGAADNRIQGKIIFSSA